MDRKCKICLIIKDLSLFVKDKKYSFGRRYICKECKSKQVTQYFKIPENAQRNKNRSRIDPVKNREKVKASRAKNPLARRKYESSRYKNDPLYNLRRRISCRTYIALKSAGYSKKSSMREILGCEYDFFKLYIESQFLDGMSWENMGLWEIDHKTPISWAKDEAEVLLLSHYMNLKPMWAKDNLLKGNKFSD